MRPLDATAERPGSPIAEDSESKGALKNPAAVALGRRGGLKGGRARADALTPEQRTAIARKASLARWPAASAREPVRSGRLSRQASEQLTEDIVAAAQALFVEKGFAATTIEDIAEMCRTTSRSVVRRFPTKDRLLVAAVRRYGDAVRAAWLPLLQRADLDLMTRLRNALRFFLELWTTTSDGRFFFVFAAEAARIPDLPQIMSIDAESWQADLKQIFEEAQSQNLFTKYDAAALAASTVAMMVSYPLVVSVLRVDLKSPSEIDMYFDRMWSFIMDMR